jgi:LPXTG-motif cell wall-anchored protein
MMKNLGILLIVLGVVALFYTGFSFTTKEKVVDLGPIQIDRKKEHSVNWPPILGVLMLIGGIAFIATSRKK